MKYALAVLFTFAFLAAAFAAPAPPADLGEPALVQIAPCTVPVRVQYYDYVPEDPDYWRAVSLHVGTEQAWFALLVWPSPGSEDLELWLDTNRDGRPDRYEQLTNGLFEPRWGWSACRLLESLGVTL
jgi:hypothetical protein